MRHCLKLARGERSNCYVIAVETWISLLSDPAFLIQVDIWSFHAEREFQERRNRTLCNYLRAETHGEAPVTSFKGTVQSQYKRR